MAKVMVMGDIHGAYRAMTQCFDRAKFSFSEDHLISLGDVSDGWPDTKLCIELLLKIKHVTYILGNHDYWTLQWMKTGAIDEVWFNQGGEATINSYQDGVPAEHISFLEAALSYFEFNNKLFVHAGILPHLPIEQQTDEIFLWDRTLAKKALKAHNKGEDKKFTIYEEVYIGHTPTPEYLPVKSGDVWLMDTGAGWSGPLTLMDIETKEIFMSDDVPALYPGVIGRTKNK